MSPNQVFPLDSGPRNPIAERVLNDSDLTYDVAADGIVIAVKAELLVRKSVREASPELNRELSKIARNCGTLASIPRGRRANGGDRTDDALSVDVYQPDEAGPAGDVEIWRLTESSPDSGPNSIDEARRLRVLAADEKVKPEIATEFTDTFAVSWVGLETVTELTVTLESKVIDVTPCEKCVD